MFSCAFDVRSEAMGPKAVSSIRRRAAKWLASCTHFRQDNATHLAMTLSARALKALRSHAGAQWAGLLALSIGFAATLEALHVSAALLIGPMIAGVIVASTVGRIRVPDTVFAATQGIIACMIARAMPVRPQDRAPAATAPRLQC